MILFKYLILEKCNTTRPYIEDISKATKKASNNKIKLHQSLHQNDKDPVSQPTLLQGERGEAHGCVSQRRKMRGVPTNVYLWKASEKPKETGENENSKFGSCIYV